MSSRQMNPDKLNHVDYHWYLVRTRPGNERKLCELIKEGKEKIPNILETYCPTHTTVNVRRAGNECRMPLFDGYVFVLATQSALTGFLREYSPDASLRYNRKQSSEQKAQLLTIPEAQMRAFMDFNENYADKVVVLERPYTDYAFNSNEGEPNEIVRVIDGPLAGCEGYVCRFRRKRGLVFRVQSAEPGRHLTVSYPNLYDLHVVRLHNTECDRLSVGTEKGRAADILIGILQACGYGEQALPKLYAIVERLILKPSFELLCKHFHTQGEEALAHRLEQLTAEEAGLILNLARYECDNPGYIRHTHPRLVLRPFLTPTPGTEADEGKTEANLRHKDFTEIIRRIEITEEVYYPRELTGGTVRTSYYAHIGLIIKQIRNTGGGYFETLLFANWDDFFNEYFLTAGKANEKLVEAFRCHAPTLYKVLTEATSKVKVLQGFKVGKETLNVIAIQATPQDTEAAKDLLIDTCVRICRELNSTTHLAVWRRYLRTVWLHT